MDEELDSIPEWVEEHEEFITCGFRRPDGTTYPSGSIEGIPCPTCDRLLTEHTKAEVRACADSWKAQRKP